MKLADYSYWVDQSHKFSQLLKIASLLVPVLLLYSSCNTSKYLKEGEDILVRNQLKFIGGDSIRDKSVLRYELQTQIKQKPNDKTFIFFKPRLWFYYRQQEKGDTTDFDKFVQRKLVEPPSIYDTLSTQIAAQAMRELLFNRGYLKPQVWYSDSVKNSRVFVTYFIKPNELYTIESYDLQAPDTLVNTFLQEDINNTYLKPGLPVSNSALYNEKLRILKDLQERGFANLSLGNFSPLEAFDTSDATVQMRLRLLPGQDGRFSQKYIGNVIVNNRFDGPDQLSGKKLVIDSIQFYNFDTKNRINPHSLLNYIKLKPGELYKREDLTITRTQLQLPAIQFADINTTQRQDESNIVDFEINLLPAKRIETNLEFELNRTTVSSQSFIGLGTNLDLLIIIFSVGQRDFLIF
ncbi:MAG: hypothetical protein IPL46_21080 [Saprospiraceae bacterium]|nr:hypothetical protein [Saprospiraceae bacterium]